ncbi:hypothetical protein SAMN05444266_10312 [Chitinophaga jiangningensis]|uniref:Uncharacterized protein n=1 Tax=Chitinophaga jiangningensis TaxID=1419482 RepID=A0A1M6ZUG2_9BACT|nr:hypothetical protein SAMN05444266_10312 [Chitinophaga jiangningensis]
MNINNEINKKYLISVWLTFLIKTIILFIAGRYRRE